MSDAEAADVGRAEAPLLRPVMPELDTIRGIAVTMVVVYHAFWTSYWAVGLRWDLHPPLVHALVYGAEPGWSGVHLFFVLSGFLITGILLDSKARPDYYRRFYFRRALRILPPYLLLLAVLLVTGRAPPAFVLLAAAFVANFSTLFGVALAFGPLWSLAVEEQYYLLWPTVVRHVSRRALMLLAAALLALAPLLRWSAFRDGAGFASQLDWHFTWFVYDSLVTGSLTAALLRTTGATRAAVTKVALATLGIVALVTLAGRPYGLLDRTQLLGATFEHTVMNLFFASMLVLSLVVGTGKRPWLVQRPWLIFLGYISYGLYLCHWLVFALYDRLVGSPPVLELGAMLVRFAVAGSGSVLIAWVSRRWYEERFLRMKRR